MSGDHSAPTDPAGRGTGRDGVRPRPSWSPATTVTAGALLGVGGFMAASLAGAVGSVHPAVAGLGTQARADDEGDVWVDNAGGNGRPHHAENRRLACAGIDLLGSHLEHGGGAYTVVSEEPTGRDQKLVTGTWSYDRERGGRQVLAAISGADLVNAVLAQGATPRDGDGFRFGIRLQKEGDERHIWVAACPVAAPPPAPAPPHTAVRAAAAVPSTGADPADLGGGLLVAAGGGCLGMASHLRRREARSAPPAGGSRGALTALRQCTTGVAGGWARLRPNPVHVSPRGRAAVITVAVAAAALAAVPTGLARPAATGVGASTAAVARLARTAAVEMARMIVPETPPARVIPVDVDDAASRPSSLSDPDLNGLDYAFGAR